MIIVDEFLKLQQSEAFIETFLVLVQLGSIMAVFVFMFVRLLLKQLLRFVNWKNSGTS
jgi:undecaprenyl-diphosphatase